MIEEWLSTYDIKTASDIKNAKREVVQEIVLSGLNRADFFNKACFYGGTALRIFYGLDRYSEDLDFSLLEKDLDFSLIPYFKNIIEEFDLLGLKAEINHKNKKRVSNIESAFLKDNSDWSFLNIEIEQGNKMIAKLRVKIEVDRDPPLDFQVEPQLLNRPYSQFINCMIKEHLFAGKMHAVLFRKWVNNEKGRDWYDLVWYIKNNIGLGLSHFNARAKASNNLINGKKYDEESLRSTLHDRIDNLKVNVALRDISRFTNNHRELEVWSHAFFHKIVQNLKFS